MSASVHPYFINERSGLRRRTLSGGLATAVGQAANFVLHFASVALLARLLTPSDFGLVAMVMAVTGIMTLFGDSGLSAATVQRETITQEQVSTLFWINAGLGLVLMLLAAALGPVIAWCFGEPRLIWITAATSAGFLFRGLAVQHAALLRRNFAFVRLIGASFAGSLAGYGLGVVSAFGGLGYWSLVIQSVGTAAGTMIATFLLCAWRPGRPGRWNEVKALVRFGGALTGSSLLNYLLRNFDNMLVGWYWGSYSLGLYSRGYAITMLPMSQLNGPINQVAMPALSRVQGDPQKFRKAFFKAVTLIAGLSLPVVIWLLACAKPFILAVLGEKWIGILPIFVAIAPAAALSTLTNAVGWVYNSLGRAGRQLRWTVMAVPVYLAGFAIALPFGPVAVAASFSILLSLLLVPTFAYAFLGTPLTLRDLGGVLWRPITAAAGAGLLTWLGLGTGSVGAWTPIAQLLLGGVLFIFLYALGWISLPGGTAQLLETWRYLADSWAKPSQATAGAVALAAK